jgi:hypothetical protein
MEQDIEKEKRKRYEARRIELLELGAIECTEGFNIFEIQGMSTSFVFHVEKKQYDRQISIIKSHMNQSDSDKLKAYLSEISSVKVPLLNAPSGLMAMDKITTQLIVFINNSTKIINNV